MPTAEDEFGPAGGGGVVFDEDRHRKPASKLPRKVDAAPGLHRPLRRADLVGPVPQFEGDRHADPGDALPLPFREFGGQLLIGRKGEGDDPLRLRPPVGLG